MENFSDFYSDRKFCQHCAGYVPYLMSLDQSYCVQCGEVVRLFSDEDWEHFNENVQRNRPKGGRPRKGRGKESA